MKKKLPFFFGVGILIFDLISKYFATIKFENPFEIFPNILSLELHKNPGLAFSIPLPTILQVILSLILLGVLLVYFKQKSTSTTEEFCLAAVIAGATGNLLERILFGVVTDFFAVWRFPIFNVADTAIFLGIIGLIFYEITQKKSPTENS